MPTLLVLGGARSGKSAFAQRRAETLAGEDASRRLVYVATAEAGDEEMAERIGRHRRDRDGRWTTVEAPLDLAPVLDGLSARDVAVVDCLTLWLTNVVLSERDPTGEIGRFRDAVRRCAARLVLVSNEVGWGIVPDNALARRFRDEAGRLNQAVAEDADAVVLVVAGLPMALKPAAA